jgi:hypothetical protein
MQKVNRTLLVIGVNLYDEMDSFFRLNGLGAILGLFNKRKWVNINNIAIISKTAYIHIRLLRSFTPHNYVS